MQIIRTWTAVDAAARGASIAIGNFDGVHMGHQSVIALARTACPNAPLAVMSFEPHPREFFAADAPPFRLMNAEARANRLAKLGVDILYELPFDHRLAGLTSDGFAREVLVDGVGARHVTVGQDFCFGQKRTGNAALLCELGAAMGFGVTVAPMLGGVDGRVSSTAIRTALSDGRPRDAASMLGHWHRIEGPVLHGEKRGRDLGYPTANMSITGLHPPRFGVYAVLVDVLSGPHAGSYHGAASVGVRPMFGDNTPNIETFLFDFRGDLYDAHLSVALVEFLRGEEKFDSLQALIDQMDADCTRARAILAGL